MLNGDVLTDIDLSAQIARHEATGARGTLALVPVDDPTAYGLVRLNEDALGARSSSRSRAPTRSTRTSSAPAPTCSSATIVDLIAPARNVSIEREIWPRLVGDGLYGFAADAYWLDIGTPERYLQGTFDILEGKVSTAVSERLGPGFVAVADGARQRGARRPAGGRRAAAATSARAPTSGSLVVLGRDVTVGAHSRVERCVVLEGTRIGAGCELTDCIVAPGVTRRRRHRDRRRRGARRGGQGGVRQRPEQRRESLPAHGAGRRRDQVLREARMSTIDGVTLDREAIARVDASDQPTDILAIPEHLRDALWKVESADLAPWDSPGGLVVAGMGGSAIGGSLARAILGDRASRPLLSAREYGLPPWTTPDTTVLCASYSGDTEETLACFEAAGVIGARRVVATSGGKLAELARADGVPVIPRRRRLPAARGGRLHDRRRARGRRAVRRRAAR